jgi:hypothetical protein
MKNRFCTVFAAAAALAAAFVSPARSGVIVDTFRTGNTFDTEFAYSVGGTDDLPGLHFAAAAAFTLAAGGTVNDIAVAANASNFSLVIVGDNAGLPANTVLGTVSSGFTVDGYIEFDPSIALSAGTYWLLMMGPETVFDQGWYPNLPPWMLPDYDPNIAYAEYGPFVQSETNGADWPYGGPSVFLPAFRVGVADSTEVPVPEPGTLALAGAGLLGFTALRRRPAPRHPQRKG